MHKIKKSDWGEASSILDIALDIVNQRGYLDDDEYARFLENAVVAIRMASEYAFQKSLTKKERKDFYG